MATVAFAALLITMRWLPPKICALLPVASAMASVLSFAAKVAPYPMKTPFGIQYVNVPVEIDEQLLQEVAKIGDGRYFRATDNRKLEQIYKEIDKMEKSRIDVVTYRRSQAHFQPFVLAGLILLLLEMVSRLTIYRKLP